MTDEQTRPFIITDVFHPQVSNRVYNKIRNFSIKEGKRKNRLADKEDRAVAEQVNFIMTSWNHVYIYHVIMTSWNQVYIHIMTS